MPTNVGMLNAYGKALVTHCFGIVSRGEQLAGVTSGLTPLTNGRWLSARLSHYGIGWIIRKVENGPVTSKLTLGVHCPWVQRNELPIQRYHNFGRWPTPSAKNGQLKVTHSKRKHACTARVLPLNVSLQYICCRLIPVTQACVTWSSTGLPRCDVTTEKAQNIAARCVVRTSSPPLSFSAYLTYYCYKPNIILH